MAEWPSDPGRACPGRACVRSAAGPGGGASASVGVVVSGAGGVGAAGSGRTRRRTEPLLSGSTSVRTWGLGRRKERFPLGREAFPARVPGLQLAAGDVIPVGKALGVNRVAGTGTAVAGRGRDGSLWVPVRWSLPAVLKNHVHTFLKQITNLFRIFMQHFMIFVAELF